MWHDYNALCVIWFLILGILLAGYAVLDGFDLGVGILHPFITTDDRERRLTLNSIGPLWDGNEVWLVTFGGAMFAMFPMAYATVFSGFYLPFMVLLIALIFRAVSIEFRSKIAHPAWRRMWDWNFCLGSTLATFLFGVTIGNIMRGIDLDADGNFATGLLQLLTPYSLLVGALAVALFALHGSLFLFLKTAGPFQERLLPIMWRMFGIFLVLYLFTTIFTLVRHQHVIANFEQYPLLWALPVLHVLAVANIPRALYQRRTAYAFISSCCNIVALVALLGAGMFPYFVFDPLQQPESLSVFHAASSRLTLQIGLIVVGLGMPFVTAYTAVIYWTFRGKVELDPHSY